METTQEHTEELDGDRHGQRTIREERQHQQPKRGGVAKVNINRRANTGKSVLVKKDCWYAKTGQPPSGTGKGKSGQGGKGKGKGIYKGDKAQLESFNCAKTGHMKKDCRSGRHNDGQYLAMSSEEYLTKTERKGTK